MSYQFKKPNRAINRVFLHCSASDNIKHDNVETMIEWHKARGWSTIGYHFFIKKDGTIQEGRSLEKTPASAKGHNTKTIAICCHGLEKDKFTELQFKSVYELCRQINASVSNKVTFHGHCEVSAKSCPVYDYKYVLGLDGMGNMTFDCKQGDRVLEKACPPGNDVKWLQDKLGLTSDGLFGQMTEAAVREFQEDNGLESDGIVGFKTWEILHEEFGS
jgi:N-acetylmuramoyl-L-alanine amidase